MTETYRQNKYIERVLWDSQEKVHLCLLLILEVMMVGREGVQVIKALL